MHMRTRPNRIRSRVMPWAWHQAMEAWRSADLARRVALPTRLPPADRQRIVITIDCGAVADVIEVVDGGPKARSDQAVLIINGTRQDKLSNRTEIGRVVAKRLPRQATKREQDESDRIGQGLL